MSNTAVASPITKITSTSEAAEGWAEATLRECSTLITKGTTPTTFGFKYQKSGIPFVRVENLSNGQIDPASISTFIDTQTDEALRRSRLESGDLLFSIAGTIGRTALVRASDVPSNTNQAIAIIRGTQSVFLHQFLLFALTSISTQKQANEEARGGAMNNISLDDVRSLRLPIPPLCEQKRIITKIEELFTHVSSSRDRLSRVPAILKCFRQSVLAAACSGRLTEDWRQSKNTNHASMGRLIDSLGEQCTEWIEPSFDKTQPRPLPDDWKCLALGVLGRWGGGGTPSKSNAEYWVGGIFPWVSPKDMKVEFLEDSQDHITKLGVSQLKVVQKDSILFVVRGMILAHTFPIGVTVRELTINQDIRSITPYAGVAPKYLLRALQNEARSILFAVRESTHGTRRLESDTLKSWPIPLPPSDEQEEIIRRVDVLFELAAAIGNRVHAATRRADKLTQSILAKAFRGELVPTEAELARREGREYEPASVLLDRIKAERESHTSPKPKQKRTRPKAKLAIAKG